jgi:hypothetical protein
MLTDYAVAAWATWLGIRLLRGGPPAARTMRRLWAVAFLAGALAAAVGGTLHGAPPLFTVRASAVAWGIVYAGIDVSGLAAFVASTTTVLGRRARAALGAAMAARLLWNAGRALSGDFSFALWDGPLALLGILAFALHGALLRRAPGSGDTVLAVLIALAGAGVQAARLAPHRLFNHNDVFHVALLATLGLLYRGVVRATPAPAGIVPHTHPG